MTDVEYLTVEEVLGCIAVDAIGAPPEVRDFGLLDAALSRPRASVFDEDAYPDLWSKAAAQLHSIVANHALVDGNKRLAWLTTVVFLGLNGVDLDVVDDVAYELVVSVAAGKPDDVGEIAPALRSLPRA